MNTLLTDWCLHWRHWPLTVALVALLLTGLQAVPAAGATAQNGNGNQTWKINIKNAELKEFVAQVAAITGKTFVVDPRVKGSVTVISSTSMDQDAVYALFLSVLRVHNFIAMPSGDVIRITPNAQGKQTPGPDGALTDIAPEELVTRVIAAQNVDSAELVKILRPLMAQYGHLAAVAEPNIVIVSDHANNIRRLMDIIEEIDVAAGRLQVVGHEIRFDETTVFDPGPVTEFEVGAGGEVAGFAGEPGVFRATRVAAKEEDLEFEAKGVIVDLDLDAATFRFGRLLVDFSEAVLEDLPLEGLSDGLLVEVEGDGPPVDGVWIAAGVEGLDPLLMADIGEGVDVEGLVTRPLEGDTFELNGLDLVRISNDTRFEGGARDDIAVGVLVEVEAVLNDDGVLEARAVEFE